MIHECPYIIIGYAHMLKAPHTHAHRGPACPASCPSAADRFLPLLPCLSRSSPFSGLDDVRGVGEKHVSLVTSPKSGVNFFHLGDYDRHFNSALSRSAPHLAAVALVSCSTYQL